PAVRNDGRQGGSRLEWRGLPHPAHDRSEVRRDPEVPAHLWSGRWGLRPRGIEGWCARKPRMVPEPGRAPRRQDPGAGQGPPRQGPHRDAGGQAARLADHDGAVARVRHVPGRDQARHSGCSAQPSLNPRLDLPAHARARGGAPPRPGAGLELLRHASADAGAGGDDGAEAAHLTRAASAPIAASDADFLAHLDGLPVGASARDGVFEGETFRHPDLGFAVRLPAGWKAGNGRSAIGAVAPDGGAIVLLDGATTGTDPVEAERAFEKEAGSGPLPNTEKLTIAGLPAVHAVAVIDSRRGPLALDLTWIAYAGRVYRITGIAPAGRAEAFRAAWRETAASFRPLTASERRAIRETRLRIARAR